jgi:predicted PurR-regulated permease PerM
MKESTLDKTERLAHYAIITIAVIVVIAAMNLGEAVLAPLALALVAGVVLSPLSDFWESRGYSPVWGALVGLAATLLVAGTLVATFQPVVARLVDQAPKVWSDMQEVVHSLRHLMRGLSAVSEGVADAIAPAPHGAAPSATTEDSVVMPSVADALMAAPAILSQILIFAGSLFFFLLTRSEIYEWVARHLSTSCGQVELAQRLRRAERHVSRYFLTITLINAGLGAITAAVLQLINLPNAMVWGVVVFIVNFVVYLGPAVLMTVLLFVGVAEFDGLLALMPAAAFLTLNTLEGQFVTPALVGRHMAINPLLVFLALIFGLWLWGPIGGIVAIPLLLWVLVLNDAIRAPGGGALPLETL